MAVQLTFTQQADGKYVSNTLQGSAIAVQLSFAENGGTYEVQTSVDPSAGWCHEYEDKAGAAGNHFGFRISGLVEGMYTRIIVNKQPTYAKVIIA